jgi:hypothetical protein
MENCSFVNPLLRALEYIVLGVGAFVAPFSEIFTFCRGGGKRGWIGYSLKPIGSWYMQVVKVHGGYPIRGIYLSAPNYLPSKLIPKIGIWLPIFTGEFNTKRYHIGRYPLKGGWYI